MYIVMPPEVSPRGFENDINMRGIEYKEKKK
jgi:hypothetical protein